tara:strand:+ start:1544 stop:2083 length:540 start_codon:yes stop_codon:yes gene_type:complete
METKFNHKKLKILFCLLFGIFCSFELLSNTNENKNSVKLEINSTKNDLSNLESDIKNPLKNITFDFTKIVDKENKQIMNSTRVDNSILNDGEFIQIKGIDKRLLLFNGTFIVEFKNIPNMMFFADANLIEFVDNLSDINKGVFKVKNLNDLELTMNSLKSDMNIISIELNTIDPSLENQ